MYVTQAMGKTVSIFRFVKIFLAAFIVSLVVFNFNIIRANIGFWGNKVFDYFGEKELVSNYSENPISPARLPIAGTFIAVAQQELPNTATLVIEKLGVSVPLVFNAENDVDDIYDKLREGVVVHPITPKPGEDGMSILLGHSSQYPWDNNPYGTVFALLDKLEAGDRFYTTYADGRSFTYEVKELLIFNPFDPNDTILEDLEYSDDNGIVAVTCWPPGSVVKRLAVRAELI